MAPLQRIALYKQACIIQCEPLAVVHVGTKRLC